MDAKIDFIFRTKLYRADMFIDDSEEPCYVIVILHNEDLIEEFGDEITLKTDFEKLLPKSDDYPLINDLRQAVFASLKNTPLFQKRRKDWHFKNRKVTGK